MKCKNPNLSYMDCWVADTYGITDPDCDFCKLKDDKSPFNESQEIKEGA